MLVVCKYCAETFSAPERSGRRMEYCSPSCRQKRWAHANTSVLRDKQAEWRITHPGYLGPTRQEKVDRVNVIKETASCSDCGQLFPACCMDFDHVEGDKSAEVGALVAKGASWELIQEEIDKCELVCANCHRIRTRDKGSLGWTRTAVKDAESYKGKS